MPRNTVVKGAQFRALEDLRRTKVVQDRRLTVLLIEAKEGGRYNGGMYAKCLSSVMGSNEKPVTVWVEVARLEKTNLFEKIDHAVLETDCAPCESCTRPSRQEWRPGSSRCGEAV